MFYEAIRNQKSITQTFIYEEWIIASKEKRK